MRNPVAKALRSPRYAGRVVKDKKREARRRACRDYTKHDLRRHAMH